MRVKDWILAVLLVGITWVLLPNVCQAESPGQEALDEAMRVRATVEGFQDLSKSITLLEKAIDQGLDEESEIFAEKMLSGGLYERASTIVRGIAGRSGNQPQVRQVVRMAVSDLRRVLELEDPPAEARLLLAKLRALPGGDPFETRRLLKKYLRTEELPDAKRAEALALRGSVQQDEAKALADFDEAVKLAPDSLEYAVARATFLRSKKKFQESLDAVEALLEDHPENLALQLMQGELLRLVGQNEAALAVFDALDKQKPDVAKVFQNRGAIYRQLGELEKAIEQYDKVLELTPGSLLTIMQRAEVYLTLGKFEEGLKDAEEVLAARPDLVAGHRLKAELLRKSGKLDKALASFTTVLKLEPDQMLVRLQRAELYLTSQKPEPALADIEHVLKVRPNLAPALRLKAEVLAASERLPEAISLMERLASENPDEIVAQLRLGQFYTISSEHEKAVAAYTSLLERFPDESLALRSRGDAYLSMGDHRAAEADFAAALKQREKDSLLLNNYAWLLATSPDDQVRDGKLSVELATRACEVTEFKLPHILSTLASAHAEVGDFDEAIKWTEKAVELASETSEADMAVQIKKELASYQAGKPWRELKDGTPEPAKPQPEKEPAAEELDAEESEAEESDEAEAAQQELVPAE